LTTAGAKSAGVWPAFERHLAAGAEGLALFRAGLGHAGAAARQDQAGQQSGWRMAKEVAIHDP
jgi:hypothetical protein